MDTKNINPKDLTRIIISQVNAGHFRGNNGDDYIPNPSTWLSQGRWKDEIKQAVNDEVTPTVFEHDYQDGL